MNFNLDGFVKRRFWHLIFLFLGGLLIGYSILPLYFLDVFPVSKLFGVHLGETGYSFVVLSEPIWTSLALLGVIIYYGVQLIREEMSRFSKNAILHAEK